MGMAAGYYNFQTSQGVSVRFVLVSVVTDFYASSEADVYCA